MIDEPGSHPDLSREDLLAIDVPALLAAGVTAGEVQGTGAAAAAVQAEASGLPLEMLGRVLTMLNRHTLEAARIDIDVVVEEPEKRGQPAIAAVVRAGVGASRDTAEYQWFVRWLANVYGMVALRAALEAAPRGEAPAGPLPGPPGEPPDEPPDEPSVARRAPGPADG